MNKNETPRIYVACLAAYNNGYLHGEWIDCDQDKEDILEEIKEMLKESPILNAEEWAIHDYENFGPVNLSEWENLDKVAELGQAFKEHGEEALAYYSYFGNLDNFEDNIIGIYEDEEDFVYNQMEETGQLETIKKAGLESFYIDFEKLAQTWFSSSYTSIGCKDGILVCCN